MAKMIFEVALKEPKAGLILFEELHSRTWFIEHVKPERFFDFKVGQRYELHFTLPFLRLIKPERRKHGETPTDESRTDPRLPAGAEESPHA